MFHTLKVMYLHFDTFFSKFSRNKCFPTYRRCLFRGENIICPKCNFGALDLI